jgi:molybdate transport system substrate-binding protein
LIVKKAIAAASLALCVAAFSFAQGAEVIVSAAASLTDVLTALKPEAEGQIGAAILLNFGGSGSLRKQIEEGAPVDVFFSAASEDMDKLERDGRVAPGTRIDLLSNAIVLVGGDKIVPPPDLDALKAILSGASLLAIGNPDSVPAGRYAVQALTSLGLYPLVEKKLVLGGTVREVLQYVESGSAPMGIVFLTDAMTLKPGGRIARLYQFPESALKAPVLYPVAVMAASKAKDKASQLIAFLRGSSAKEAFVRAGFVVK